MSLHIVEYTTHEVDAVASFNARMRASGAATDFLLPDSPSNGHVPADEPVKWTHYIALDASGEARGGFLLMEQRGWLNGQVVPIANYQAPLSEGIVDRRYGLVAMQMLKYVQRLPYVFVVGMGDPARPLPRLLAAAGWSVQSVPFFFKIVQPARAFRELGPLQTSRWTRTLARLAAQSGAAWTAVRAFQARGAIAAREARDFRIDRVTSWDSWADEVWEEGRGMYAFAAVRDRESLARLYPLEDSRYLAYCLRQGERVVGWTVCLKTPMRDHRYFGNLTVATVLDGFAAGGAAVPLLARVVDEISPDADVVVTNQTHSLWIDACRRCGFLAGPSNFLFAASKPLAEAIASGGVDRIHVVRGDGDGRVHL